MELHLPESQPAKRRTIGYLGSTIEDGIAKILWSGIQEHCEANGLNLVSFIGRELESPGGFRAIRTWSMIWSTGIRWMG